MSVKVDRTKIPRSYREYLEKMKEVGDLVEIDDEVDWHLEMGAIFRHAQETCAPAPLFNKIKDAAPGFRAADWGLSKSSEPGQEWRRLAMIFGLPPDTKLMDIQKAYIEAKESGKQSPPNIVDASKAPCKQNKWTGDEIDLNKIPAPIAHDGDGARYIQTAGINIVQTPDGKWTNWSTNRAMIVSKNTMTGQWWPMQHNGMILEMWKKLGKDMPFALAFGVPPVVATQSGSRCPDWVDEYDMASALLGGPIDMVKCETSDLLVPAEAEIVLEGYISATEIENEGPFGEYPGYLPDKINIFPREHITCVTYRNNPILPLSIPGIPIDNCHVGMGFFISTDAVIALKKAGLPIIDGMFLFESAIMWFVIRVPLDWHNKTGWGLEEFIRKIGNAFWTQHVGASVTKILVVDERIDPSNVHEVVWAFASRNHPTFTTFLFPELHAIGDSLESYHTEGEIIHGVGTSLVIYSCLENLDRVGMTPKRVMSFKDNYPEPIKKKVLDNWEKWGFVKK